MQASRNTHANTHAAGTHLQHLGAVVAVDPGDGLEVQHAQRAGVKPELPHGRLRGLQGSNLLGQRLQHADGGGVVLDDHVHLVPLVLALEQCLLVLVLAHALWWR